VTIKPVNAEIFNIIITYMKATAMRKRRIKNDKITGSGKSGP
jgi:hypothetical protein